MSVSEPPTFLQYWKWVFLGLNIWYIITTIVIDNDLTKIQIPGDEQIVKTCSTWLKQLWFLTLFIYVIPVIIDNIYCYKSKETSEYVDYITTALGVLAIIASLSLNILMISIPNESNYLINSLAYKLILSSIAITASSPVICYAIYSTKHNAYLKKKYDLLKMQQLKKKDAPAKDEGPPGIHINYVYTAGQKDIKTDAKTGIKIGKDKESEEGKKLKSGQKKVKIVSPSEQLEEEIKMKKKSK